MTTAAQAEAPATPPAAPEASVVHDSPGRLRLKVPDRRGDRDFFARLGPQIAQAPDVLEVETNAHTASVLIKHASDRKTLLAWIRDEALLAPHQRLMPPRPQRPSAEPNWRTVVAVLVAFLALVQLMRGQVLAPAITLAFYAAQVATWGRAGAGGGSDAEGADGD